MKSVHIQKSLLVIIILASVSGCSWFRSSDDDCPECDQDVSGNVVEQTKHYCYGTKDKRWECANQSSPDKINTEFNEPARKAATPVAAATPLVDAPPQAYTTTLTKSKEEPSAVATELASNKESSKTILAEPPSAYTVQLIAMKDLRQVLSYAEQVGIEDPLYASVLDEGQVWHLLLLGIYDDSESASTAKDLWIGTRVLKVEPWIRKLAPLQKAIKRNLSEP